MPRFSLPFRQDELMHYGILGMHWGIRRYQNPDGTLTAKGKQRLSKQQVKNYKTINKANSIDAKGYGRSPARKVALKAYEYEDVKQSAKEVKNSFIARNKDAYDELSWTNFKNGERYLSDNNMPYSDEAASAIGAIIYCAKKGKDAKTEYDNYWKSIDKYNSSCDKVTKKLLGKYGNKPLDNFKSTTGKELLKDVLKYSFGEEMYGGGPLSSDLQEFYGYMKKSGLYGSDKDVYKWVSNEIKESGGRGQRWGRRKSK